MDLIGLYFLGIFVAIIIFILIRFVHRAKVSKYAAIVERAQMEEKEKARRLAAEAERKRKAEPLVPEVIIPYVHDNKQIAYRYPDVQLSSSDVSVSRLIPGKSLILKDNGSAIEVFQDSLYIGQLPNNRISGMVRDWNRNGDPYLAFLSYCSPDGHDVKIAMAFYVDKLAQLLSKNPNAKKIKLSGKPDDLADAIVGIECDLDYDPDMDCYKVIQNDFELGFLPASALKYAEDNQLDPDELTVVVSSVDYDVNKDRDVISVYISD